MKKIALKEFLITTGKYPSFIETIIELAKTKKSSNVCVANVHMYIEAYKNEEFLKIVNNSDIVTPDGKPLTWALRCLYGIRQERVAGMDLLPDLLKNMEQNKIAAYFYGGSYNDLKITEDYLRKNYADLRIAGLHSPPFGSAEDVEKTGVIEKINTSQPIIVFVVLGCPKQEKWMAEMKKKINGVMIGIGGALPVMIGIKKRAPKWMQRSGLEWLFRLIQEPNRLFKRYAYTNILFIWLMFLEFIKIKLLIPLKVLKRKDHTNPSVPI